MCLRACSLLYRYWFDVLSPVNIEVLICLFAAACQNRMQVVIYKRGKTVHVPIESPSGGHEQSVFLSHHYFPVSLTAHHIESAQDKRHQETQGDQTFGVKKMNKQNTSCRINIFINY